jgi:NmrA-like family protein
MSAKLVSVIGATGIQGGSVVNALLKDKNYSVRAITRNAHGESAKALTTQGVEVVQVDINNLDSLISAFKGSYAIYGLSDFFEPFAKHGPQKAIEIESEQGINIAKAAAATQTLQHFIWSTLPNLFKISNGKYLVPHFKSKNIVDDYIRSQPELLAKTTFFWVTFYTQNLNYPMYTPIFVPNAGKYIQLGVIPPDVPLKTIGDARINVGLFAKATLDQPEKTRGNKIVLASIQDTTVGEFFQTWAKTQGKSAQYVQTDSSTFNSIWPMWADEMGLMMEGWGDVREKSWTADIEILSKDELGVNGIKGVEESFAELSY